jgi:hypothetical protein
MVEIRMLTDEEKKTRFDFVWSVEGWPWIWYGQKEAELALRLALTSALSEHGVLWRNAYCGGCDVCRLGKHWIL